MRFVVFGAGAIGSGIGGHLHRTGYDALLVGRPAHVNRIREQGLRLITAEQTYTLQVPAVSRVQDIGFTDQDVVLLCVKSQDTDQALVDIRAAGGDPHTLPILCCQNSITNEPAAIRYFRRVYGVLIVVPGIFLEPGVVHNNSLDNAGFIEVGQFPAGADSLSEEVARALSAASYNTGDLRPEDANDWSDGGHRPLWCGGRPFAWEVAHLAFDRAGILARAPWGQPLGAEFVQEIVAKKGNASGQVR